MPLPTEQSHGKVEHGRAAMCLRPRGAGAKRQAADEESGCDGMSGLGFRVQGHLLSIYYIRALTTRVLGTGPPHAQPEN